MNPLVDQPFDGRQDQFESYMSKFGSQRVALVNNGDLNKFEQALRARGLEVEKTPFGAWSVWAVAPQRAQ